MKNVLITGVSGYIGRALAAALVADDQVARVIGIDIRPPLLASPKFSFFHQDVRAPLAALLAQHGIDTLVHTAYVLPPLHDTALMESVNVEGTRNVLAAAAAVSRLLYTSSTTAYGFHPDNPAVLTEDAPLRGNADFTYARNKREIEAIVADFTKAHPAMGLTVLRPCFVMGPGIDNPLSAHLKKRFVVLPKETSPLQFVHEDDLIGAMMLCLKRRITGVFNIAGAGTITVAEMVSMLGNTPVWIPSRVLHPLNQLAWTLRLHGVTRFPSAALGMFCHPWIASPARLVAETGFTYAYDSRAAFASFAASAARR